MTLQTRLTEFNFNLETMELLQSLGQSPSDISSQMTTLGFSSSLVSFCQSSRQLLNSVLLRLTIYGRQNFTEQQTRQSLSVLNNAGVNSLLDYLFVSETAVTTPVAVPEPVKQVPVVTTVTVPEPVQQAPVVTKVAVPEPVQQAPVQELEQGSDQGSEQESDDDEEDPFNTFFDKCIVQTEEATDILKTSEAYTAFQEWWSSQFDDDVPDKKELKDYLNDKLGKCVKSKWTNVMLA